MEETSLDEEEKQRRGSEDKDQNEEDPKKSRRVSLHPSVLARERDSRRSSLGMSFPGNKRNSQDKTQGSTSKEKLVPVAEGSPDGETRRVSLSPSKRKTSELKNRFSADLTTDQLEANIRRISTMEGKIVTNLEAETNEKEKEKEADQAPEDLKKRKSFVEENQGRNEIRKQRLSLETETKERDQLMAAFTGEKAPAAPAPAIDETAANPSGSTTDSLSESRSELSVEVSGSSSAVRVESNKELRDKNGFKVASSKEPPKCAWWLVPDTILFNRNYDTAHNSREHLLGMEIIGLYFAAFLNQQTRLYTSYLVKYYNQMKKNGWKVEIVFISMDDSEKDCQEFLKDMGNWLCLPWGDQIHRRAARNQCNVSRFPRLVIFKNEADGILLTEKGKDDIQERGEGAWFHWTELARSAVKKHHHKKK